MDEQTQVPSGPGLRSRAEPGVGHPFHHRHFPGSQTLSHRSLYKLSSSPVPPGGNGKSGTSLRPGGGQPACSCPHSKISAYHPGADPWSADSCPLMIARLVPGLPPQSSQRTLLTGPPDSWSRKSCSFPPWPAQPHSHPAPFSQGTMNHRMHCCGVFPIFTAVV